MPFTPITAEQSAQLPNAEQMFIDLVEENRVIKTPDVLLGVTSGAIPMRVVETDADIAIEQALKRIADEHERVLCARHDDELHESIDPTPDPAARKYLGLIGLIDPHEELKIAT